MIKLWVDDARPAPADWQLATSYEQAIAVLKSGQVVKVSLDYDLYLEEKETTASGIAIATKNDKAMSGYDVAQWIEKAVSDGRFSAPLMRCHSANPTGQRLITAVINRMTVR